MRGLFVLLWSLMLCLRCLGQAHDTLIYKANTKLKWENFTGKAKPADWSKGAQITVTINLKVKKVSFWSGKPTYDAFAVAFTDASWVKPGYKDDYTLAHEQLHFDIAHLYAETLELEINNLSKSAGQKDQVENILKKYLKEMGDYQALYDQETRGGNNSARQKEWANKIQKDLRIINKVL